MSTNIQRITGFSGFDVDGTVQKLMQAENKKLDKAKQERQLIQWRQDLYRDVIGSINTFKSSYFDVLKSDTYMLSSRVYSAFKVTSSDTTNKITATASGSAIPGDYKISVSQVAKAASITGGGINVQQAVNGASFPIAVDSTNNQFTINFGTGDYNVALDSGKKYNNLSEMTSDLNQKMGSVDAGGGKKLSDRVQARLTVDGAGIEFVKKVEITDANSEIGINMGTDGNFTLKLDKGNYTMDDIAAQINAKMSTISGFPAGVTAQSTDELTISFINKSDKTPHAGGTSLIAGVTAPTINGGTGSVGGSTASKLNFDGNKITYNKQILQGVNDTLTFSIQGLTDSSGTASKLTIKLDPKDYTNGSGAPDVDTLINDINSKLSSAISGMKVDGKALQASDLYVRQALDGSGKLQLISDLKSQISVTGNASTTMGFPGSFELSQSRDNSITNLITGKVDFTINGVNFKYDFSKVDGDQTIDQGYIGGKGRSISGIMSDIATKAGVNINYSELTKTFTMSTKDTGSNQSIVAQDNNGTDFLQTILGSAPAGGNAYYSTKEIGTIPTSMSAIQSQDAIAEITEPGGVPTTITKSSNSFLVDGVSYNIDPSLVASSSAPVEAKMTITQNTDDAYNMIKAFIDKYNDLIGTLNTKMDEKRDYNYQPLTDDEKTALKNQGQEDKITDLENKAKQGLLKNDPIISNMLSSLRSAFYDTVKDAGINLTDLGLSTSADTTQRGKIIIDEDKLKTALSKNGDQVTKLFTQQSNSYPLYTNDLNAAARKTRYNEEGIFQRINDILNDNVRMTRDNGGNKGLLIQQAGIKGDVTDVTGFIPQSLKDKDERISKLIDQLNDKENAYYKQFTAMEQALTQLNSQSQWLASQLGMGSS